MASRVRCRACRRSPVRVQQLKKASCSQVLVRACSGSVGSPVCREAFLRFRSVCLAPGGIVARPAAVEPVVGLSQQAAVQDPLLAQPRHERLPVSSEDYEPIMQTCLELYDVASPPSLAGCAVLSPAQDAVAKKLRFSHVLPTARCDSLYEASVGVFHFEYDSYSNISPARCCT